MKKLYILILAFFQLSFAQSHLDALENNSNIKSYIVNKKMFEMMGRIKVDANDKDTHKYLDLIKNLNKLRVYTSSNSQAKQLMEQSANKHIGVKSLNELIRTTHDGKTVKIYANTSDKNDVINEMLMHIEGGNNNQEDVLMILEGKFMLEDITVLTEKLNLPGAGVIKK